MFRSSSIRNLLVFSALCALSVHAPAVEQKGGPVSLDRDIKPVLEQYCFSCHNAEKTKGDLNLVDIAKNPKVAEHRDIWNKVIESLESGDMPPEKKPRPDDKQKGLVLNFLDGELTKLDCTAEKNPGRVTIRRLNREEYKNTVRDLLRVDYYPQDFPNDEVGYGFDNIGDVLSLSPMLMEKYLAAAEEIAQKAIIAGPSQAQVHKYKGNQLQATSNDGRPDDDGSFLFQSNSEGVRHLDFPATGEYILRVRAYGDQAGTEPCKLVVRLDGKDQAEIDVPAKRGAAKVYEVKLEVVKGGRKLGLAFVNDFYDDKNPKKELRGDRNLYVEAFELQLPNTAEALPASHRALITKMPAPGEERAAARELLRPFVEKAYRRPIKEGELERVAAFVDLALKNKSSFLEGMQVAVQAVLCSPQFLFRWELDPGKALPGQVRELNDFEVASRLAYFLWSSMPDEQLFILSRKGELLKNGNLQKQVTRMLADWKARNFVNNFAGQWLQIRNIWEIVPDPKTFPKWTDDLRGLMKEETERYFEAVMKEDRNVLDLLDSDFTFVNERLAKYYGIPGVSGSEFKRVSLPAGSPRGGVLTQGAVLLTTSTPTRTSPVIRGKWILEQILGTPPPPPPANVPPLNEQSQVSQSAPLRVRLSQHSEKVECAGCHKRMDPLGFALENFDATGAWRDLDGKFPIDASGKLPDGKSFRDIRDLKRILKSSPQFVTSLSEKLLTYALGRGLDYSDQCSIRAVVEKTKASELKFSGLINAIVTSDPFLKRKTAEGLTKN
jgi:hypothetical protein